jgi:hypothetical protein
MRITFAYATSLARTVGHRLAARITQARVRAATEPDAGYTTETVVITALLIILAIGAVGIIAAKVTDKANSLNF